MGVDPGVIARVFRTAGSFDVESNYFPLIEFEQPDLPWRYTPARANTADRLRPWMCLITLREDEIAEFQETGADGGLPVVTVTSADFAAAHRTELGVGARAGVRRAGAGSECISPAVAARYVTGAGDRAIALASAARTESAVPRFSRADVRTRTACRPARSRFGRRPRAGLDGGRRADPPARLLSLALRHRRRRRLRISGETTSAAASRAGIGVRPLDASDAGLGPPPADTAPLVLEGALVPPGFQRGAWTGTVPAAFRTKLAELLNTPAKLLAQPVQRAWSRRLCMGAGMRGVRSFRSMPRPRGPGFTR